MAKRKRLTSDSSGNALVDGVVKRRRRLPKAGKLAELMNMPMDILFEIFGHLRPLDILSLARTTKAFRNILMYRSSTWVWRAARANIPGLPDCPPDLSEPQWAHLAFYPFCHICHVTVRTVDWRLRIRICSKCIKGHIGECVRSTLFFTPSVVSMVPHRQGRRNMVVYVHESYLKLKKQFDAIQDPEDRRIFLVERRESLTKIEKHASLCEEWTLAQARDRSQQIQELKEARKRDIIEKLTALGWGEEISKLPPYNDLVNHRLVKVPQQLTDRIWNNIRQPLVRFMETTKTSRLNRELAALIPARKRIATNILRRHKISQLPFMSVMPDACEFCQFPIIKAIVDWPVDIDVNEASFDNIVPLFPDMFDEWRANIIGMLVKKVKREEKEKGGSALFTSSLLTALEDSSSGGDSGPPDGAVLERMKLATTVFRCRLCSGRPSAEDSKVAGRGLPLFEDERNSESRAKPINLLFYPNVLGHLCLTKRRGIRVSSDPTENLDMSYHREKWSCDSLELDKVCGRIIEGLVKACGLDPTTTTAHDMDRIDTKFACLLCATWEGFNLASYEASVSTFGWRAAVNHRIQSHNADPSFVDAWHRLTPHEEEIAHWMAIKLGPLHIFDEIARQVWLCMHCHDLPAETLPMQFHIVLAHLAAMHNILEPLLNRDYAKDFAAPDIDETINPFQISDINIVYPKASGPSDSFSVLELLS